MSQRSRSRSPSPRKNSKDMLDVLPSDVVREITSYVAPKSSWLQTSKKVRDIVKPTGEFQGFLNLPVDVQNLVLNQLDNQTTSNLLSASKIVSTRLSENLDRRPTKFQKVYDIKKLENKIGAILRSQKYESQEKKFLEAMNVARKYLIDHYPELAQQTGFNFQPLKLKLRTIFYNIEGVDTVSHAPFLQMFNPYASLSVRDLKTIAKDIIQHGKYYSGLSTKSKKLDHLLTHALLFEALPRETLQQLYDNLHFMKIGIIDLNYDPRKQRAQRQMAEINANIKFLKDIIQTYFI
jgi:hypothetical protein